MTEFTIVGNFKGRDYEKCEFYVEEGKNTYTIHMPRGSKLMWDITKVGDGDRMRVMGIILKDSYGNDIFVCNKATIMLGGENNPT